MRWPLSHRTCNCMTGSSINHILWCTCIVHRHQTQQQLCKVKFFVRLLTFKYVFHKITTSSLIVVFQASHISDLLPHPHSYYIVCVCILYICHAQNMWSGFPEQGSVLVAILISSKLHHKIKAATERHQEGNNCWEYYIWQIKGVWLIEMNSMQ